MGKYARRIPKTIWEHAQVESHLPVVSPFPIFPFVTAIFLPNSTHAQGKAMRCLPRRQA